MIELIEVSKKYNKEVISNFNYVFNDGIYQIIGENGTGKTTLYKILTKQISFSGDIYINNKHYSEISRDDLLEKYITYISQDDNLLDNLTVLENIEILTQDVDNYTLEQLIKQFELENHIYKKVKDLSGGERKKVQLIVGLVFKREILILDEPDNHLDDDSVNILKNILLQYGGTVIFTSHNDIIENCTKIDIKKKNKIYCNINGNDTINEPIEFEYKLNNVRHIAKNTKRLFLFFITFFFVVIQCILMWDTTQSINTYNSDVPIFFENDNTIFIEPPIHNNYASQYLDETWLETTPFLFDEQIIDLLEQTGYIHNIYPLSNDYTNYTSFIEYNNSSYYTDDQYFAVLNTPYSIANNSVFNGMTNILVIEGDLPIDNSNQVAISKSIALQNSLEIGDDYNIDFISLSDSNDTFTKSFEITSILDDSNSIPIVLASYGLNTNFIQEEDINNSEENLQYAMDYVDSNSPLNNYNKIVDTNKNYYWSIVIEANSSDDAKELVRTIYDYDKYIEIRSNFSGEFGIIQEYKDDFLDKRVNYTLYLHIIYLLILILIFILDIKYVKEKYIMKLRNYGMSYKECKKIYNYIIKIYILLASLSSIYIIIGATVFNFYNSISLLLFVYILSILLIYILSQFVILIFKDRK